MLLKFLTTFSSLSTIAFGVWHFFVPKTWKWTSYIAKDATELVLAVRAVNIFFSLSLVLIGAADLLFLYFAPTRFALVVMLGLSGILWGTRCVLQVVWPQGSMRPVLRLGMLGAFILLFACYLVSLLLVL